jgi:hypothetical protein
VEDLSLAVEGEFSHSPSILDARNEKKFSEFIFLIYLTNTIILNPDRVRSWPTPARRDRGVHRQFQPKKSPNGYSHSIDP